MPFRESVTRNFKVFRADGQLDPERRDNQSRRASITGIATLTEAAISQIFRHVLSSMSIPE